MGKDLKGRELGNMITQRKDGVYYARIIRNGVKDVHIYSKNLDTLQKKLDKVKKDISDLPIYVPEIKISDNQQECDPKKGAFIYFITDGNYVKIGVASNIKSRMKILQTGNPNELRVIHSEYSDFPYDLEKTYHDKYKKYHIRGEWYNILNIINGQ